MTYVHRILQVVEFKYRVVTGPMVDQIMGTTSLARARFNADIKDVIIYCRAANSGARKKAKEHEKMYKQIHNLKIEIVFVEVKDKV